MVYRAALLAVVLVCHPSSVLSQSSPPASAAARSRPDLSTGVRLVLEMRWLALNDNFFERVDGVAWTAAPKVGSHAIYDQQQANFLLDAATGDHRSLVKPLSSSTVLSGETCEMPPFVAAEKSRFAGTIRTTWLGDQQAVHVEVTYDKQDGKDDVQPAHAAAVPLGSHLLIRTPNTYLQQVRLAHSPSLWERLKSTFTGSRPKSVTMQERLGMSLLVTPRLVPPER